MCGISLLAASTLITHTFDAARQLDLPPLCVVVLDVGCHLKSAMNQDDTGTLRYQIAHGKAAAALGMGIDTVHLFALFEQGILPDRFADTVNGAAGGKFIPQPGGALLHKTGNVIGAIGVSGASSDEDEVVIRQAIAAMEASSSTL